MGFLFRCIDSFLRVNLTFYSTHARSIALISATSEAKGEKRHRQTVEKL